MVQVGAFQKVSYKQFEKDFLSCFPEKYISEDFIKDMYEKVKEPCRATTGSAGYDIKSVIDFTLKPRETIKIPTGIRVKIEEGWFLSILPRSGQGFKYHLQLDNTVGVIDSDYYEAENEGHIMLKITNDGKEGKLFEAEKGDAVAQAVFMPYGVTYTDFTEGVRVGGFGSTDREKGDKSC